MTDHPIIFSAPMVRALLDGRKTMTRRLAWREGGRQKGKASPWQRVRPGDRLWVQETWAPVQFAIEDYPRRGYPNALTPAFAADWHQGEPGNRWLPSIHMPKWASRLTLTVTATKIERLNAIDEGDAVMEGMQPARRLSCGGLNNHPVEDFCNLWQALHGEGSWDANPEVVALTFTVHNVNIDRMETP